MSAKSRQIAPEIREEARVSILAIGILYGFVLIMMAQCLVFGIGGLLALLVDLLGWGSFETVWGGLCAATDLGLVLLVAMVIWGNAFSASKKRAIRGYRKRRLERIGGYDERKVVRVFAIVAGLHWLWSWIIKVDRGDGSAYWIMLSLFTGFGILILLCFASARLIIQSKISIDAALGLLVLGGTLFFLVRN